MDIVSFQQEGRWYGLFDGSIADLTPTVYLDSFEAPSSILFGFVCYRGRPLLALRLGALLRREQCGVDGPPRVPRAAGGGRRRGATAQSAAPDDRRPLSLLVVSHGEHLVGLPTESVACILDVRRERIIPRIDVDEHDEYRVSRLRLRFDDHDITVIDAPRLVRLGELVLGSDTGGRNHPWLLSGPC